MSSACSTSRTRSRLNRRFPTARHGTHPLCGLPRGTNLFLPAVSDHAPSSPRGKPAIRPIATAGTPSTASGNMLISEHQAPVPSRATHNLAGLVSLRRVNAFKLFGLEGLGQNCAIVLPRANPVLGITSKYHDLATTNWPHLDSAYEITLFHGRPPEYGVMARDPSSRL